MSILKAYFHKLIRKTFSFWEMLGFHITPVHFYEPIPNTRELSEKIWEKHSSLVGISMNAEWQRELLSQFSAAYKTEYDALSVENDEFGSVDAEMLYCMIRHFKPKRIIEVGSGYSTLVMLQAIGKNGEGQLTSIDPYPKPFIKGLAKNSFQLMEKEVQSVPIVEFEQLRENDILFIDSSHVLKIGSDVQYEFLEILPRLKKGAVIHVHDIFLPAEYPKDWVVGQHRFFNEQYLLQAFLAFNNHFETLWAGSFMHITAPDALASAFSSYNPKKVWPGSFWMKRI